MKVSIAALRTMATTNTIQDIADTTGSEYGTTWRRLKGFGIKPRSARHNETRWSPEETDKLIKLRRDGLTPRQIARKLKGRNRDMVLGKIFRLRKQNVL